MKSIFLSLSILIFVFSGCANQPQPFNPNKKGIIFVKGKPYRIPYGVKYYIFTEKHKKMFEEQGFNYCSVNDIVWYNNKISNVHSVYGVLLSSIKKPSMSKMTLLELKDVSKTFKSPIREKNLQMSNKLIKMTSEKTTLGELKYNTKVMEYLNNQYGVAITINMIKKGDAGCNPPMSDKEYDYFVNKQRQQAQFEHENNIQGQKSLDKSFDRINNSINNMTPKTYNINHSGSVNVYHY